MANFVRPVTFEWALGSSRNSALPRKVILAEFRQTETRPFAYVSFVAVERGTLNSPDLPEEVRFLQYTKHLARSDAWHSVRLREGDTWMFAGQVEGIAAEEINGRAAQDATWSLFYRLILGDPDEQEFFDAIGDEWLDDLRKEALGSGAAS